MDDDNFNEAALFIKPMPGHVKQRFKAYCVIKRVSMRDAIISFMRMAPNDGGYSVAQIMETARLEHEQAQAQGAQQ